MSNEMKEGFMKEWEETNRKAARTRKMPRQRLQKQSRILTSNAKSPQQRHSKKFKKSSCGHFFLGTFLSHSSAILAYGF
jgi:hypothetical protein